MATTPTTTPSLPLRSFLHLKPNSPKSFLCLPARTGSYKLHYDTVRACPCSSAAGYASVPWRLAVKLTLATNVGHRKPLAVRGATIEEIEAGKSSIEKDAKARMEKTIETVRTNFNSIRTGRANPAMLDKIEAVEKAIVSSDVGLTPNNDGEVIRLSIRPLTSERRRELSKVVAKLAEEGKVALRNIRRDALKAYEKLEKEKKLSEDNVKDLSSDLQKLTDECMRKIETVYKQKEQELLKV